MKGIVERINREFGEIVFEPKRHTYKVKGKNHIPVSHLIDEFVNKVDFNEIAGYIAQRDGVSKEEILNGWCIENKKSTDKGTQVHEFAEVNDKNPTLPEEKAVINFWFDLDQDRYKIVKREVRMYHKLFTYAGTGDLLLWDTLEQTLIIADYKTNKDLFKNYKGKLLSEPFETMEDSPFNKYQIQLSLYQLMIEQLGFKVSERWIIWLLPTEEYKIYKANDLTSILTEWMHKTRYNAI